MFKNPKTQKRISAVTAVLCVLSLLVGVTAYFTDRESASAGATAGNMDMIFTDISASASGTNGITSNNEFAQNKAWKTSIVSDGAIINPGDYFDLSYELTNTGSKSMDIRQQLTVTSTVPMTGGAEEYQLTITGGNDATKVNGTLSDDKLSITYDLTDIILDGSVETEEGATDGKYIVRLDFLRSAGNAFQESSVSVAYKAQAKQHRNTDDSDWAIWAEVETKFEQIVETGAIIPVYATDSDGNDLNASAQEIIGDKKEDLLSKLEQSGLVDSADAVDALIEIESDDFEDLASTTFDVSEIAQEGDKVVILHFNETTQEWEYISEETVDANGEVNTDFSSFSPVAFVVVKPDGSTELIPDDILLPYFGKPYYTSPAEGIVMSFVFAEDGSALSNMYIDGELVNSDSAEVGTFSYENGYVIMANGEKATISADRAQIDMGDGMVLTLVELVPGLYETGTIAALKSGDFSVVPDNLITPWDQLVADGHVERGSNPGNPGDATIAALAGDLICPKTMTQITNDEFSRCENLTGIMTLGTVTKIGQFAFNLCSNLETIFVPHNEITSIGKRAFQSCTRLTDAKILAHVNQISEGVFNECTSIESITIGDSATSIVSGAFAQCSNLSSVTIPDSVLALGYGCFQNCPKLTKITYTGTVTQWNSLVKSNSTWNINCVEITVTCTGDSDGTGSGTVVVPAWSR